MLDINLFREDKGHNPEIIRDSQRRRFADVKIVDEIIELDKAWRQRISPHLLYFSIYRNNYIIAQHLEFRVFDFTIVIFL